MGLTIEFEFADGRTTEVHMSYSYFHANSICAGGRKSHFENMRAQYDGPRRGVHRRHRPHHVCQLLEERVPWRGWTPPSSSCQG